MAMSRTTPSPTRPPLVPRRRTTSLRYGRDRRDGSPGCCRPCLCGPKHACKTRVLGALKKTKMAQDTVTQVTLLLCIFMGSGVGVRNRFVCGWFRVPVIRWGVEFYTDAIEPQTCFFLVSPVIRIQIIWGSAKKGTSGQGSRVAVVSPRDHSNDNNDPNAEGTRTMPGAQRTEMPVRGRTRKAGADV